MIYGVLVQYFRILGENMQSTLIAPKNPEISAGKLVWELYPWYFGQTHVAYVTLISSVFLLNLYYWHILFVNWKQNKHSFEKKWSINS